MRLLLILLPYLISAQTLPTNIKKYYIDVNQAEMSIVNNNINEAINYYETAFKQIENPFCRDRYNLAVCYAKNKNKTKTFLELQKIVSLGYPLDSIKNNKFFKKYAKKLKREQIKFDKNYRDIIDSLLYIDQKFRKIDSKLYKDTIKAIDIKNVETLKKLFKDKGFPSESRIGVYAAFNWSALDIIFKHNYYHNEYPYRFNFSSYLEQAIKTADIDARIAITHIAGLNGNDPFGSLFNAIIQHGYAIDEERKVYSELSKEALINLEGKDTKKINESRADFGLCSIEDYQKKIRFQRKNKEFKILVATESYKKFYWKTKEEYEKSIKNVIFLE